jgi:hypothetical protein
MNKLVMGWFAGCIFFALMAFASTSYCQTGLIPNQNATLPFANRLTLQNEGVNAALAVHRDAFGKPCLDIEAGARRELINPKIYDHVISVYNKCLATIKLRVCYYHSDHCVNMEIQRSQRKDIILGIYPNMQHFSYSYQEKF